MSDESPSNVVYTPEFKRNIRQLAKKYRHIRTDVQPVIEKILQGHCPGNPITGIPYRLFKARVRNTDAGKGKRGGYRLIYQVKDHDQVVLITIYSKSDQSDISFADIRRILASSEEWPLKPTG